MGVWAVPYVQIKHIAVGCVCVCVFVHFETQPVGPIGFSLSLRCSAPLWDRTHTRLATSFLKRQSMDS